MDYGHVSHDYELFFQISSLRMRHKEKSSPYTSRSSSGFSFGGKESPQVWWTQLLRVDSKGRADDKIAVVPHVMCSPCNLELAHLRTLCWQEDIPAQRKGTIKFGQ